MNPQCDDHHCNWEYECGYGRNYLYYLVGLGNYKQKLTSDASDCVCPDCHMRVDEVLSITKGRGESGTLL